MPKKKSTEKRESLLSLRAAVLLFAAAAIGWAVGALTVSNGGSIGECVLAGLFAAGGGLVTLHQLVE